MEIHVVIATGLSGLSGLLTQGYWGYPTCNPNNSASITPTTPITPTTCVDLVGAGRHVVLRKIFVNILDLSADLRE